MTVDLTKITTPFGLLDPETQEALRKHGGPYEWWDGPNGWLKAELPSFSNRLVSRVKPQPPAPREWWIVDGCEAYSTERDAREAQASLGYKGEIVHVREVPK